MFSKKTLKKISIYCIASIGMCVVYTCILFIWSTPDVLKANFHAIPTLLSLKHK